MSKLGVLGLAACAAVAILTLRTGDEQIDGLLAQSEPRPTMALRTSDSTPAKGAVWQSLFNGRDLAGWRHVGGGSVSVQEGQLVLEHDADRRPGYLVSEATARDFEARFVCKALAGDSGFFFRSRRHERTPTEVAGPQVQLNGEPDRGLGGLYELHGRGWVRKPKAALNTRLLRDLDWIDCLVTARGGRIVVTINNQPVVELEDGGLENGFLSAGFFALQIHGGGYCKVVFSEIAVRVLD